MSPGLPKTEAGNDPHACHSVYEPLRQSMNENEVYAALQAQESKLRLIHQTVFSLSDCVPLPCWSSSQNAGIPAGLCHGGARQVTNQHNMVDFFFLACIASTDRATTMTVLKSGQTKSELKNKVKFDEVI